MNKAKEDTQRTKQQNRALHKWFDMVSIALISEGITSSQAFREMEIWPTKEVVKEAWKQVQARLLSKESTTELTTSEIDQVYDVMNKILSEGPAHLHIPFPSIEEQLIMSIEASYEK